METWKDIKGYQGLYQVSDIGSVRNVKTDKILKPFLDDGGYLLVSLFKDGKRKTCRVHRLVAETFIPNPENKSTVDHINTIKTDNRVSNLRWATYKEQMENEITKERHAKISSEIGKRNGKRNIAKFNEAKKKKVLCVTTGEIFESTAEATKYYGIKDKKSCL